MLDEPARTFTETYFAFSSLLPPTVLVGLAAVAALAVVLYARGIGRKVGKPWRITLTALRAGVMALVFVFLLNPSVVEQRILKLVPTLAVVVDTSQSLLLPDDEAGSTRLDQMRRLLGDGPSSLLDVLARDYHVELHTFGSQVRGRAPSEGAAVEATEPATDILGALGGVLGTYRAKQLVGVLLVSDGRDTAGKASGEFLRTADVPVVAVPLGDPSRYRDIWISGVEYSEFAFVRKPVTFDVIVEGWGYSGASIPVVLKQEGRILLAGLLHAPGSPFRERVQLSFVPEAVGQYTFSVGVTLQPGEAIAENNQVEFSLSVVRDKIRVLMVSGAPSWSYHFLRGALKRDPTIDLVSFVILRSPWDEVNVPQKEISLIPFPTDRLFAQELRSFDVVLFDDFSFGYDLPLGYMANLRDFVRDGGGMAFFGGQRAFFRQEYYGTPLAELLPVELDARSGEYDTSPLRMALTTQGASHPITRLVPDPEENRALWETMPELEGINKVSRAKEGAVVLGVHPAFAGDGGRHPILAVWKYGDGRSLALLSDEFWKWNFVMVGEGRSNQHYLSFVKQMLRWLVRDPQVNQVNLFVNRPRYAPGEEAKITVTALRDDFSPAPEASLNLAVRDPAGREIQLPYVPGERPGEFVASFTPTEDGFHRLTVEARVGEHPLGESSALFETGTPKAEFMDGSPGHDLLRLIAEETGGKVIPPNEMKKDPLAELREVLGTAPVYKVTREERIKLWNRWWAFVLLLSLLSVEWWLRRMAGLV